MAAPELLWLPEAENWRERLARARTGDFVEGLALAHTRLDFLRVNALDLALRRWPGPPPEFAGRVCKLAILSSSTTGHLPPALRIAALRRGIWLDVFEGEYGQYRQALSSPRLKKFEPDAVLFALDSERLAGATPDALREELSALWREAKAMGVTVLQQTPLPIAPPLLGSNEHRLTGSRAALLARINYDLRAWADAEDVDLVAVDAAAVRDGLAAWRDPASWARAKQEIRPAAAPMYGDLVARVLAARLGLSRKCLVLDLDNTLWGGVVGDDGLDGIVLGQGSPLGEGFLAVQQYARDLSRRGVILAVCSKNDEANAWEPFDKHPEMILRRDDIACFVANWEDKAENIQRISERLNIGLDSLVFLDDNPFERQRVRGALPMVAVPEVPEDPALVPDVLAAAGYFEAVAVTEEDRARAGQYQRNAQREAARDRHGDLGEYLRSLEMVAAWGSFDALNRQRIVQLINKTNQFNLTTRRYDEADYDAFMTDENVVGLHLRLADRFGDNGLISVVIAKQQQADLVIDTWLMSCRVLGREVERAALALIVAEAKRRGGTRVIGKYIPSAKNGLVRDHYERLGFELLEEADGRKRLALTIAAYQEQPFPLRLEPV